MYVIFHNVGIVIEAKTPEEAYTKLCEGMSAIHGDTDWTTDTYSASPEIEEQYTSEIWPRE
jgi:hypothetical protein